MVILVTAYAEFALQGFDLDVVDYLLKPVPFDRFVQAINKAQDRSQPKQETPGPTPSSKGEMDYLFVKSDYKLVRIRLHEILYIEGLREYVRIHTLDKRHVIYQSMKKLEELLPEGQFARAHKSYIVALDRIDSIYGNTIEIGEVEIPIGKSYKDRLMASVRKLGG